MSLLVAAGEAQVVRGCEHKSDACKCICACRHETWGDHANEIYGLVCYVVGCMAPTCYLPPVISGECGATSKDGAVCQRDAGHEDPEHAKPINVSKTIWKVWQ